MKFCISTLVALLFSSIGLAQDNFDLGSLLNKTIHDGRSSVEVYGNSYSIGEEGALLENGETMGTKWEPKVCLLYTSPSPRDRQKSRMPSSA